MTLKFAIIGAGSSYTPEILEGLAALRAELPVTRLDFYDIDPARMETVAAFCRRFAAQLGLDLEIHTTTDRRAAIEGARYIITQIRVGGNQQRAADEQIALKYGVIGQETTGPGGMFKALRTIPPMLEIARDVEQYNPEAWIINYANPTGILVEAVQRYTNAKIIALCSGGVAPRYAAAKALGVRPEQIDYDLFGLNHGHFAYNFTLDGRPLTDEEFDQLADRTWGVDADLVKALRLYPSGYMQYYFHRRRLVNHYTHKGITRGMEVQEIEKEIFAAYADPNQHAKPEALNRRGGGGYAGVALGVVDAIHNNRGKVFVVNTRNQGATPYLPEDASLEMPALVGAYGVKPLVIPDVPRSVWGLVAAIKNYEQLTVEAAVSGDRDTARLALLAHPLISDWDTAKALFDELLAANCEYLPQFF